jgi:hypothetical protein
MNIVFSSFLPYDLSLLTFSADCLQVAAVIRNKTLLEVIFIADQVIGVDRLNLYPQYTPNILTQALALYNNNFANCDNKNPGCFTCTASTNDDAIIPVSELIELSQRLPGRRFPKSIKTRPISSDAGEPLDRSSRLVDVPILVVVFVFVTVVIALYLLAGWFGKRANREYRRL